MKKSKSVYTDWTYSLVTSPDSDMYEWLYINCHKRWYTSTETWPFPTPKRRITFQASEDMTAFKLRFPVIE